MCLDTVDKKPKYGDGQGWKVFRGGRGKLISPFASLVCSPNEWIEDRNKCPVERIGCSSYPAGFHIYRSKDAAERAALYHDWIIKKVHYKDVVATGRQCSWDRSFRTVVARQIYIEDK